ncbi:hypothetical protein VTN49DRAFT_7688 [Thermomyces lanuginosus]|uniref:uncharacterized protein n=1 Tax=Thermomyces lanuginosus TaxID=5541 RepID=UPI0037428D11
MNQPGCGGPWISRPLEAPACYKGNNRSVSRSDQASALEDYSLLDLQTCSQNSLDFSEPRIRRILSIVHFPAMSATTQQAQSDSTQQPTQVQRPAVLEEDDEFEDFPIEDWPQEETEQGAGATVNNHLWEESWDDDDENEDFSKQLKEEIKKVEASK